LHDNRLIYQDGRDQYWAALEGFLKLRGHLFSTKMPAPNRKIISKSSRSPRDLDLVESGPVGNSINPLAGRRNKKPDPRVGAIIPKV
jgi:hypothetical protein